MLGCSGFGPQGFAYKISAIKCYCVCMCVTSVCTFYWWLREHLTGFFSTGGHYS